MVTPVLLALALAANPGGASPWSLNSANTLLWGGEPWLPVGARVDGSPDAINTIAGSGIRDFIVTLPADGSGWAPALEALEKNQARYMIQISTAAPSAECFVVEPQSYRRENISDDFDITLPIPQSKSALALLAAKRDSTIRWSERFTSQSGVINVKGETGGFEQVLLIYPEMRTASMPDFWEGLDRTRDNLLRSLKQNKMGAGFRGIINPLGKVLDFPDRTTGAIPSSPLFQLELETRLTQQYRTLDNVLKAWAISTNDIQTMRQASRLIPLWSGTRGVGALWDPTNNRIYLADMNRSTVWADIRETIAGTSTRRMSRLIDAVRQAVDVPVVQEWAGWDGPYASASSPITGLSASLNPTNFSSLTLSGADSAGTLLRRRKAGILLASSIRLPGAEQTRLSVSDIIAESEAMGFRGWFFEATRPEDWVEVATAAKNREGFTNSANQTINPVFYPLGALNPALPGRISASGLWWLPTPVEGDRIDFGSQIMGYRISSGREPMIALWLKEGQRRVKLRCTDPKALLFKTLDGSDPYPRARRNDVDVTLTTSPLIIVNPTELPVPEESFLEAASTIKKLCETFTVKVDPGGQEIFQMQESIKTFEKQPGPAYLGLVDQMNKLLARAAPFSWLEMETARVHNFSEIAEVAGASNKRVLRLDSRLPAPPGGYSIDFSLGSSAEKTYDIWIAGRMSEASAKGLRVVCNSASTAEPGPPMTPYGDGLAWRYLGKLTLPVGTRQIQVIADAPDGPVDIDVIVISEGTFRPEGGSIPREWALMIP